MIMQFVDLTNSNVEIEMVKGKLCCQNSKLLLTFFLGYIIKCRQVCNFIGLKDSVAK